VLPKRRKWISGKADGYSGTQKDDSGICGLLASSQYAASLGLIFVLPVDEAVVPLLYETLRERVIRNSHRVMVLDISNG
jgi:hypothetical protein